MMQDFPQIGMRPVYGFFHYAMDVLCRIHFPTTAYGVENIPGAGKFIVASNHASMLDPPVVGAMCSRQLHPFARGTLWRGGIISWWLDAVGTIPVDREAGSDVGAIKRILHVMKEGGGIVLFPEGTRTRTGGLQPPKAGVGLMACRTGAPVVPTRIFGSFEAMGRDRPLRLGTPLSVVFGPPLFPADYDDPGAGKERYQRASERIMAAIAELKIPASEVL